MIVNNNNNKKNPPQANSNVNRIMGGLQIPDEKWYHNRVTQGKLKALAC